MPKLVEPRRVSWPTLIMVIGTLIGGWALIGVLIDVSKSFDTVIGAASRRHPAASGWWRRA